MKKYIILSILVLGISLSYVRAQVDRTIAPKPGPAPKIQIGNFTKFELPNGLKVFVVENHRIPRVSFSLSLNITPELEGVNTGIGSLTSELIGTGTKNRTKEQINDEIDFISGSLNASAEGIYASSLKKHTPKLLDLMADVTMNSVFTDEELSKIRTQTLSGLASDKDDPSSIAANVSSAIIYGKKHPYGEFETETTVKSISLMMCTQYYQKYFNPNVAYLSVVGDITPKEAKKLVEKYFGNWQKKEVPVLTYSKNTPPEKTRVLLVDRPQSVQSVINICYPIELNLANPDFIKARVANTVLGGGTFRLFNNLREKHAYTYGAYSSLSTNILGSSFKASANVRNAVTDSSVTQFLYEMKRIRTEPVPADELQMVKNYLTGNFALSLENPQTVASFATNTERYSLPKDFYSNYLKNIQNVTSEDIQAVAQKYFLPEQANILIVGKASEIADGLKKFSANGKIEFLDTEANPYDPSKMKKPIPDGVTVSGVIEKYIQAIGGKDNIAKIKDVSMKASFSMQGMNINVIAKYKFPGKYVNEIQANGQVFIKQIYNNGKGKTTGMQGNKDLEGEDLEDIKAEAEIVQELKYADWNYKTELKEIAIVNGEDAYVVEITSPLGKVTTDYFSVNNGLKVQSKTTSKTSMGELTRTTTYADYKPVNGVLFPFKIKQEAGPQNFDMKVESIDVNTDLKDDLFTL